MSANRKRVTQRAVTAFAILAAVVTAGCGVAQAVGDSTVSAAKWAFTTQVKSMNVDLRARASINADAQGQSLSTVVRFYQLKDATTFAQLTYSQLQSDDLNLLKADLVATKDVVLRPDASASLAEPMNADAQLVGVVAFFREPVQSRVWKLAIAKKQWKKTDPVKIEVNGNELVLVGADPQPVKHDAPQQAVPASPASSTAANRQG
ncbi:type VI secretion system protein VasD [Paraburkholderia bannensis]|uniref:Type VI secretion system protein VasD n=1 Tax=Paraburkholderia bannensis TaxID=765414 RepID=A0A7W9WXD4_9BURK|nr:MULTISPECIES: type VI secretion system lipoprotein TssJ [Paraburkholderia]MBB3262153.1 type VI secretion system protein VasD [Paraburkholderia sp. WP4_3_2]MBB6107143.1 type VI secretion system protein VasD [Paraburkholderia bannensis]